MPGARELRVQLKVPVWPTTGPEQTPVLAPADPGLADTNFRAAGSASVMVTLLAVPGPAFLTLTMKVTWPSSDSPVPTEMAKSAPPAVFTTGFTFTVPAT